MKVLIVDNYDSFTYNLYQYIGEVLEELGHRPNVVVVRNDEKSFEDIGSAAYDRIVISPGPGNPADPKYFGVCENILLNPHPAQKILGVCLGMQGMAHVFGGRVVKARIPMHGKTSAISHDGQGVFAGLPQGIEVMRYHSLIAEESSLPDSLVITARTTGGHQVGDRQDVGMVANRTTGGRRLGDGQERDTEIMGLRHKTLPIEGIQFHPESFATEGGKVMLKNFIL